MPFQSLIQVQSRVQGTTRIVTVAGEIDLGSVEAVRQAVDAALSKRPETVVLDLSEIAFCDSSGIHVVVNSHHRAAEQRIRFVVIRPTGPAWRAFEVCQIDREVQFVDSVATSPSDEGLRPSARSAGAPARFRARPFARDAAIGA
jgi:anti-anti-sigma factor